MTASGKRFLPILILLAVSLGTAALIESCVEAFGIDGDAIQFGRVGLLATLVVGSAGIVATLIGRSSANCRGGCYRTQVQREVLDRLPFAGRGFRFTVIVAVLQALCMASLEIGDTPSANEDVIGWATSSLLVLNGTVVVRFFLASHTASFSRHCGFFRWRIETSAGDAHRFCRANAFNRWVRQYAGSHVQTTTSTSGARVARLR